MNCCFFAIFFAIPLIILLYLPLLFFQIDHFEEPGMPLEITLRFWRYDESAQTYVLNTRVDMPHSQRVNSLVFHPRLPLVVTAGHDKRFRLWHTETLARKDEAPVTAWACRSIGFHREMVLRDAAFSEDGSLLAVACGQLITLWDPLSNTLQGTLCHSPPDRPVLQLAFLRNSVRIIGIKKVFVAYNGTAVPCGAHTVAYLCVESAQLRSVVVGAH